MKKIRFIIIILPLLFFSCENITEVDLNLESQEYIVVQAELEAGADFKGVTFTRTLPVNEEYDIKKAELKDITAYLKVNGIQIVPLHHADSGIYKPIGDLEIVIGNTYELFAKWEKKSIYSKTFIPEKPVFTHTVYQNNVLSTEIKPKQDEVYGAIWKIWNNDNEISHADDFYLITEASASSDVDLVPVRTQEITEQYQDNFFKDITYMQVYVFDKPFLDFFKSKNNSGDINNIFAGSGGAVSWNIKGENAIGLFIGYTKSDLIKPSIIN